MILSYIQFIVLDGWLRLFDCISHLDGFSKWGCNIFQTSQTTKTFIANIEISWNRKTSCKKEETVEKNWQKLAKKKTNAGYSLLGFLWACGCSVWEFIKFSTLSWTAFGFLPVLRSALTRPSTTVENWQGSSVGWQFQNFFKCLSRFQLKEKCIVGLSSLQLPVIVPRHRLCPYLLTISFGHGTRMTPTKLICMRLRLQRRPRQCLCTSKRSERSRATPWVCKLYNFNIDKLYRLYVILTTWLYWMSCFALVLLLNHKESCDWILLTTVLIVLSSAIHMSSYVS